MHDPMDSLKAAFDSVHAEAELKKRTGDYVAGKLARRHPFYRSRALRMAAAAVCMVLLLFAGYGSHVYFDTVCVVSIDINPSVELNINAFDRVIAVRAYNADGSALAKSMKLRFLSSEEAVEKIVSSDTIRLLLEQEEYLAITVVGEDEAESQALCARLQQHMDDQENTHYFQAAAEDVAQAHSCGLSYGKYRAYQEALEQGKVLTVEEVQGMTMQEIRERSETHCASETEQETSSGGSHGGNGHQGRHHN